MAPRGCSSIDRLGVSVTAQPSGGISERFFKSGLVVLTMVMVAVLLILLQWVWTRTVGFKSAAPQQTDSVAFMAFQLDREILLFRNQVQLSIFRQEMDPGLLPRFDTLQRRLDLLQAFPTPEILQDDSKFERLIPGMVSAIRHIEALLLSGHLTQLPQIIEQLDHIAPDLQSLVQITHQRVVRKNELLDHNVRRQDQLTLSLATALLIFLILGFAGLIYSFRKEKRERAGLHEVNQALQAARSTSEAANVAKSRFLANMSHELRTPFNGLLGMMQVLEHSGLRADQQILLNTAQRSGQHLLNLLNDILDLSAINVDKLQVRLQPMNVDDTLLEVIDWMQRVAEDKGLVLAYRPSELASPYILGDATRIRQILLNLLSNAIKFTAQGQVLVLAHFSRVDDNKLRWSVSVKDTGVGISREKMSQLFQRFQPGDESTTRIRDGAGLGLEISRSLAQRMGGDLRVESQEGQGSTFVFEWVAQPAPTSVTAQQSPTPNVVRPERLVATIKPLQLLVVDDNAVNRLVLGSMLEQLDCVVTYAEDGLQGLRSTQEQNFDLVMMDLHMPHMDGFECAKAIRSLKDQNKSQLPIIAVTADVLLETQEQAHAAGFNDFLHKPVQRANLTRLLSQYQQLSG